MSAVRSAEAVRELLERRLQQRGEVSERFFDAQADRIARLCHQMAERFARGGRLIAVGLSPAARSDVRHVAVEFVHPVIVGKRALPALGLTGESSRVSQELDLIASPQDIVIAFGEPEDGLELSTGIAAARARGCLTIAFAQLGAEWELVHVFFEHRGLLEGRTERRAHDAGASSFLYPFLAEREHDLDAILADVRESALMKADEVQQLRTSTLLAGAAVLGEAAAALRASFEAGGCMLALGNGGSATDAMDAVADFVAAPATFGWPGRRALDLCADSAIITAIANDIGPEAIFARQIIAYARSGDTLLVLSTSGNSLSALDALAEARRRELVTIALIGYDGGRIAAEQLADHVVVTPSQHIPRIQEAQATAYHVLRELVEL